MKRARALPAFLLILAVSVSCATLKPGADPVLVRAQQTYATALNACDLLFNVELENRALLETKLPGTHATVDKIKVNAKKYLPQLLNAIDAYSAAKSAENANTLTIILAVVEEILRDTQATLTKAAAVAVSPPPKTSLLLRPRLRAAA